MPEWRQFAVTEKTLRKAVFVPVVSVLEILHGDLSAEHMLVTHGCLSGVIDWGDVHVGHWALDLSIGWTFFPAEARDPFFSAYGPVDEETRKIARFQAARFATV